MGADPPGQGREGQEEQAAQEVRPEGDPAQLPGQGRSRTR